MWFDGTKDQGRHIKKETKGQLADNFNRKSAQR